MKIVLNNETIDKMNLSSVMRYTSFHANSQYFSKPSGTEHYKLIAYIAKFIETMLIDIGTYLGYSALALHLTHSI